MIQLWLAKITTKLTKLSEWEKTTKWFYSRLVHDQKNNLAEAIKDHK
jgi:predicted double-glycine peptidase